MFGNFVKAGNNDREESQANDWRSEASASAAASPVHTPEPASFGTPAHSSFGVAAQEPIQNILNSDVEIEGSLEFTNDLLIDGKVVGDIRSNGTLKVGEHAFIQAEIRTKAVIIHGHVEGNITVDEKVVLMETAELLGDIVAETLEIRNGAAFVGKSTVGASRLNVPQSATPVAPAAKAATPTPTKPVVAEQPAAAPAKESQQTLIDIDAE